MSKQQTPEELTELVYTVYGSDSGYLFGIPPDFHDAVLAVVKVVHRQMTPADEERERGEEYEQRGYR